MLMMFAGLEIAETESNTQTMSLQPLETLQQTMSLKSLESLQRQFTYADLIRITNNFERVLSKGGIESI